MIIDIINKNFFIKTILIFLLINYKFSKNSEILNINTFNMREIKFIFNI